MGSLLDKQHQSKVYRALIWTCACATDPTLCSSLASQHSLGAERVHVVAVCLSVSWLLEDLGCRPPCQCQRRRQVRRCEFDMTYTVIPQRPGAFVRRIQAGGRVERQEAPNGTLLLDAQQSFGKHYLLSSEHLQLLRIHQMPAPGALGRVFDVGVALIKVLVVQDFFITITNETNQSPILAGGHIARDGNSSAKVQRRISSCSTATAVRRRAAVWRLSGRLAAAASTWLGAGAPAVHARSNVRTGDPRLNAGAGTTRYLTWTCATGCTATTLSLGVLPPPPGSNDVASKLI